MWVLGYKLRKNKGSNRKKKIQNIHIRVLWERRRKRGKMQLH